MKYFEKYLSDSNSFEDIDISVHCDVQIFDWLMKYISAHDKRKTARGKETAPASDLEAKYPIPALDSNNVISILISSDFLRMEGLVEECVTYVSKHLSEIVRLPIDMNCINTQLLKKIAAKVDADGLDQIRDRRDKLMSKLFMKKLELLL